MLVELSGDSRHVGQRRLRAERQDSVRTENGQVLDRRLGNGRWAGEREPRVLVREQEQVLVLERVQVLHDVKRSRHTDRRAMVARP